MASSKVNLDVEDGVAVITLDSPETGNALTAEMAHDLVAACDEVDANYRVGAAVVRSSGAIFCAGAHRNILGALGADPLSERSLHAVQAIYESFTRVSNLTVPSIAAVRGAVVGGGVNVMLATDLRVVAADALIDSGFLRMGFHPGGGHFALLARALQWDALVAVGIFNEKLTGARASELGLAWEALPADRVEDRALELAGRLSSIPELGRMALGALRAEVGPPRLPMGAAQQVERAAQLHSFRHRQPPDPEEA